ncbi:MAG TPA: alpha/beta hydrolase [Vicinamibacterales bacterium]|nr:alpha/beta hydrolase [Vicinamibacterales bacterium]
MKRVVIGVLGTVVALTAAVIFSVRLSPWPSLAIVTYFLSFGDRASDAALESRVPAGIVSQLDIPYGSVKDEVFDVYHRAGLPARPAIVWVHGGAFVSGSKSGVANYLKILASRGYTTIAVEYSKGPGVTYPKPIEQVNAALGFVVRHAADLDVDPATILLAGDSAGAHIAGQLALITTDPAYAREVGIVPQLTPAQLTATLLLSGVYDPAALNLGGTYGWFNNAVMCAYSGVRNFRDDDHFKFTSITRYVTGTFPQTFISSGNADPLAPQAVALAGRLHEMGVHVDTLFFPSDQRPRLRHEYQFNLNNAAGQEALRRIWAFLDGTVSLASRRSDP